MNKVSFTTPQTTALVAMSRILASIHSLEPLSPIFWLGSLKDPDQPLTAPPNPKMPMQRFDIEVYIDNDPERLVKVQMDVTQVSPERGVGKWVPAYGVVFYWNQNTYVLAYHCAFSAETYDPIIDGPIFPYPYSGFSSNTLTT